VATHIAIDHDLHLEGKKNYLSILIILGALTMPYTLAMENKLGGAINNWYMVILFGN
jgi:hypothetical protein